MSTSTSRYSLSFRLQGLCQHPVVGSAGDQANHYVCILLFRFLLLRSNVLSTALFLNEVLEGSADVAGCHVGHERLVAATTGINALPQDALDIRSALSHPRSRQKLRTKVGLELTSRLPLLVSAIPA